MKLFSSCSVLAQYLPHCHLITPILSGFYRGKSYYLCANGHILGNTASGKDHRATANIQMITDANLSANHYAGL